MDWDRLVASASRPRWILAALLAATLVTAAGVALVVQGDGGGSWLPFTGDDPDAETRTTANAGNGTTFLTGTPPADVSDVYEDSDNDGLPDLLENYVYGSDANRSVTSEDGHIPDGWLAKHGYDPTEPGVESTWAAFPGADDAPEAHGPDGLNPEHRMTLLEVYIWQRPEDWNETEDGPWDNGLDPTTWDQGAGLPFTWLIHHDLDPFNASITDQVLQPADQGGDDLSVQESYETATDPTTVDTDGDGLDDHVELDETGTDPAAFSTSGRDVADGWAITHDLDPLDENMPFADPDLDGLSNRGEFLWSVETLGLNATLAGDGLDPNAAESGGAGIPDGWLVDQGLDPLEPGIAETVLQRATDYGPAADRDVEELVLTVEDAYTWQRPTDWSESVDGPWTGGLHARTNDTDGDGLPDAVEIAGWTVNVTLGSGPAESARDVEVASDPLRADTDGDGLTDADEFLGRTTVETTEPGTTETTTTTVQSPPTDPTSRDTDFDGLSDHVEVVDIPRRAQEAGIEGSPLDPTVQDSDGDALLDGDEYRYWSQRAARYRTGATSYEFENRDTDGVSVLGTMPGARSQGGVATENSVADALEPWGDLDDDGDINILDADADGDELNDGWEVEPTTYAQSPFASQHPRPVTDPANDDTDGDHLPDGWETRFAEWDFTLGGWNLDPSTWDTFGDDTPDGQRDLDGDSITWHTFIFTGATYEPTEHAFNATNLVEYDHGTDPNQRSTPGNGLRDGWTIFWGQVYPEMSITELGDVYPGAPGPLIIPPGSPRPSTTQDLDAVTDQADRFRFSTDQEPGKGEVLEAVFNSVEDASTGQAKDVYRFREHVEYRFTDEQAHGTNPYLEDTDADGAPDAWEAAYSLGGIPDPLTFERDDDNDGDDLTLFEEHLARTDPGSRDTDLGGVPDGEEDNPDAPTDPLNPTDDVRLRDASVDTDGDGITDIDEVQGWEHPSLGPIQTDPTTPDTDGDGLADGDHVTLDPADEGDQDRIDQLEQAGVISQTLDDGRVRFLGEVGWDGDPRAISSLDDGVPDGWRAAWDIPSDGSAASAEGFYTHARPAWWDEATMGPWWWGLVPDFDADADADGLTDVERVANTFRVEDTDLDQDGLSDVNGEDPTPAARPELVPPDGFPDEPGITDDQARDRAATFGVPTDDRDQAGTRDTDDDGVADIDDRLPAILDEVDVQAPERDGTLALQAGTAYTATGRVTTEAADGTTMPVPNATVAVHLWGPGQPLGYGVTGPDGHYEAPLTIETDHEATTPPPGIAFLSQVTAPITWTLDLSELQMGLGPPDQPNQLRVQVYNTSGAAGPSSPTYLGIDGDLTTLDGSTTQATANGIVGTVSEAIPFTLETSSTLTLDAPANLTVGQPLPVDITLVDGAGTPLTDQAITLTAGTIERELTTDDEGQASTTFRALSDTPGTVALKASYEGDDFVLPTQAEATVPVRHPAELTLARATPLPAGAGEPLTVEGTLRAPLDAANQTVRIEVQDHAVNTTTGPSGAFQATLDLPSDLAAGDVPLTASFNGSDTLAPASDQATVPVKALPHIGLTTVPGDTDLRPNAPAELVISVTVGNNTPLPGTVVVQGLPGSPEPRNATVDGDGTTSVTWTTGEDLGAHRVVVTRAGDEAHLETRNQTWISLKAPTRISVNQPPLPRGQPATLQGTLRDVLGTPIRGGTIQFTFANETVGETTTGADGSFNLDWTVPRDLALGPAPAAITYLPSEGDPWDPTTRHATFTVESAILAEPVEPFVLRADPQVTVEVTTDTGQPVSSANARLHLTGLATQATAPLDGGTATFTLPLPRDATPGTYPATITLEDIPHLGNATAPLDLTVASPVTLDVDAPPRAPRGQAYTLAAQALDDLQAPVANGTLDAHLEGAQPTNTTLPAERTNLSIQVPLELPTGPTRLDLAWTGPTGYLDASTALTVEVIRGTQLTLDLPDSIDPGDTVDGTVQLTSDDGTPLADEDVLVRDTATGSSVFVTTNETGHARLLFQPDTLSPTKLEVRYAGDQDQGSAITTHAIQPVTPTPGQGPGALLTALGLAAMAAVVALAIWAWRRRQLQQAVADVLDVGADRVIYGSEYRAAVLHTYERLVEILADHNVVPADTQTLNEYKAEIRQRLGVRTGSLDDLFEVFDEALYAPWPVGADERRRAHTAFLGVARDLQRQLHPSADQPPEEVTSAA